MKNLFSESLRKKKVTIAFTSFIFFAGSSGTFLYEGSEKTVTLNLNGKQTVVETHAETVKQLLAEEDITLNSKDYLTPNANTELQNNLKIVWRQAKQVEIVKDGEKKTVWTTAGTVADLLKEQKIVLNDKDQIFPNPKSPISSKMLIRINVDKHILLVDGGKRQQVWSTSITVADFLKQRGIILNEFDRIDPSLTSKIKENEVINIIRVEKVTDVVEEPIQFAVIMQQNANLAKGTTKTVVAGVKGLRLKQYAVIRENGKVVSRVLMSEKTVREKQDQIVAVGTNDSSSQGINGRVVYVSASAYTASCNGCTGLTATGMNLISNPNAKVIAVDPSIIPLGKRVYVEGYGYAIAADTGSAIIGNRIDVFFPSTQEAYLWGVRKIKVTVLN